MCFEGNLITKSHLHDNDTTGLTHRFEYSLASGATFLETLNLLGFSLPVSAINGERWKKQ